MALFLSKEDILGPAQVVAAQDGTGRAMGAAMPQNQLSGINSMLGTGKSSLDQVENILGSVSNIFSSIERIRAQALQAKAEQSATNGVVQGAAATIDDAPANPKTPPLLPSEMKKVQPMKISVNEDGVRQFLAEFFAGMEQQSQETRNRAIQAFINDFKDPLIRGIFEAKAIDAFKKALPGLVRQS